MTTEAASGFGGWRLVARARVLMIAGVVALVLSAGGWVLVQGTSTGMSCSGSESTSCEFTPGLLEYVVVQVAQRGLPSLGGAAALAIGLGAVAMVLGRLGGGSAPILRRGARPGARPGASLSGAASSTGPISSVDLQGAVMPNRLAGSRRALRLLWVVMLVIVLLALAGVVMTSLPSMSDVWNAGTCGMTGCTYPFWAQVALGVSAIAPAVLSSGLLMLPVLVLTGAVLRLLEAGGSGPDTTEPAGAGTADPVAWAVPTATSGAAPSGALPTAPAVPAADWWDELSEQPDSLAPPTESPDQPTRRSRSRSTSWDGRDLSPFMRPGAD
ncbi:hypothetical protein [Herbiconiux liangxiaofengii]|uniref:hypothetical protein n=1 Tax=Herbiconiux liangxiaofengii TaxID=3342795 RepID=UPI0035B97066